MTPLEKIAARAKTKRTRIVLSEGEDPRIVAGALRATADGLAEITLLGRPDVCADLAKDAPEFKRINVVDPATSSDFEAFAQTYLERRKHKGVDLEGARAAMCQPLGFAAMMVNRGLADGTIGGAVSTTADTVRAALQIIGKHPDSAIVSSFFLMVLRDGKDTTVVFADCGLVVFPNTEELASIALSSAKSFADLIGDTPKIAMLAFSTQGSSTDERLERVITAVDLVREADPTAIVDGELQFDAAFDASVSQAKAPDSPLQGDANVFIFPNLHAGNIGYKIAQRIGGATAIGPILQGLAKPANDLSRGCTADDVYHMIAVTAVQAASLNDAT